MSDTIESANTKILHKISLIKTALSVARDILKELGDPPEASQHIVAIASCDRDCDALSNAYMMGIAAALNEYYTHIETTRNAVARYYRLVGGENYVGRISALCARAKSIIAVISASATKNARAWGAELVKLQMPRIGYAHHTIQTSSDVIVRTLSTKQEFEACKCGGHMLPIAELSEMHCESCSRVKKVVGAVFRDEQYYPQEGQKTKHGAYKPPRHLRFWLERLQARRHSEFDPADIAKMKYVIERDKYDLRMLSCADIRTILKDNAVGRTKLNDFAPELCVLFGGRAPPQFTFQETREIIILFNTAMMLYDKVNPAGGNKPYYPYFLYQIFSRKFAGDPEKLRILKYIHLQSRDTVTKNDTIFRNMCEVADDPGPMWKYYPIDPMAQI